MTEDGPVHADTSPSTTITDDPTSAWRRWSVLLPALAFVAGLLLGGGVIGAATRNSGPDGSVTADASPSTEPTPTASGLTINVPGPCVQAANRAGDAYALLEKGVAAARDLNASALADLVAQVQRQRPEVQALVRQCQEQAGSAVVSPSPLPSTTPGG